MSNFFDETTSSYEDQFNYKLLGSSTSQVYKNLFGDKDLFHPVSILFFFILQTPVVCLHQALLSLEVDILRMLSIDSFKI